MICTTVKNGVECLFMTKTGCSYKGGVCREIVEKCTGCNRTAQLSSGWYCTACPDPPAKWQTGKCNLATHIKEEVVEVKQKLNPLKASKRKMTG